MGIKNIHLILIIISILFFLCLGFWSLKHNHTGGGIGSLIVALGLIPYCINFIRGLKNL